MVMLRSEIKHGNRARVLDLAPRTFSKSFLFYPTQEPLVAREVLDIIEKLPRNHGGVDFVRVGRQDGSRGEVYFTDLLERCMRLE